MSAYTYAARTKLVGLPCWGPTRWLWSWIYSWLESKLRGQGRLRSGIWVMIHNREWQKSSAISGALWALNTILIYKLVSQLGHGWQLNMAVSLTADAVMYGFNKLWVWRKRKASLRGSAGWSFIWWVLFFGLNTGLAWLLMSQIDLGTLWARGSLGLIGFAMNPIVFKFRDKMAFKRSTRMTEMA